MRATTGVKVAALEALHCTILFISVVAVMKKSTTYALILALLSSAALAQVRPLATGDIVTRMSLIAQQAGNDPITFASKSTENFKLVITETGDRRFEKPDGSGFVRFANDKNFTDIMTNNKVIEPKRRIARFPQGEALRPGMKWNLPTQTTRTSCGDMILNYAAASDEGPQLTISINDTPTQLNTIRINYEAIARTCDGQRDWRRTREVLYSPDLNELVSTKVIEWSALAGNARTFMDHGDGWTIISIKTAEK